VILIAFVVYKFRKNQFLIFTPLRLFLLVTSLLIFGFSIFFMWDRFHESYDILIDIGHSPNINFAVKYNSRGYYSFYANMTKLRNLKPHADYSIKPNYKALFLVTPRKRFSEAELIMIDRYLNSGRPVILMIDEGVLVKDSGAMQLLKKYDIKVTIETNKNSKKMFDVFGESQLIKNVFRAKIDYLYNIRGVTPLITLKNDNLKSIALGSKKIKNSSLFIMANLELFNNRSLGVADKLPNIFQEQLSYLEFNFLEYLMQID
jgi:hypothetical protein